MKSDYGAVVIGAGPAGSMAAKEIVAAGFSTLLLEKHQKPGVPLCCGEAVSRPSFEKLIKPKKEWISNSIEKVRLCAPNGKKLNIFHAKAGYILDRKIFDYDLAQCVVENGGELACDSIGLRLKRDGDRFASIDVQKPPGTISTISARIFIAADGVESKIARLAGIDNLLELDDIESLLQYRLKNIEVENDTMEFHFGNRIVPGGYIWVFPKSANTANVGLGINSSGSRGSLCRRFLDDFIKKRFGRADKVFESCGVVPKYMGKNIFRKRNLLVAGDAARALDSLSGAGIINAMLSGKYAGRAAVKYLSGEITKIDQIDEFYPGQFLREKGEELSLYRKLRNVYVNLNDGDFSDIIVALSGYFNNEKIEGIAVGKLLANIVKTRPRLLRLVRYLV